MDYEGFFKQRIQSLKGEGNYRVFADIEREAGRFPNAVRHNDETVSDVTVWCSNDYLGMGQHPSVIDAMQSAIVYSGSGAGGTRNISGNSAAIVALEAELADLHSKERALVLTSGYVANEASISAIAKLLDNALILSDEMNHASIISIVRMMAIDFNIVINWKDFYFSISF